MKKQFISEAASSQDSRSSTSSRRWRPSLGRANRSPDEKRFIYALIALPLVSVVVFAVLHIYSPEIFVVALIIEFLTLVEIMDPASFSNSWRRNISLSMLVCLVVFAIILYSHALTLR